MEYRGFEIVVVPGMVAPNVLIKSNGATMESLCMDRQTADGIRADGVERAKRLIDSWQEPTP